jgi:hypothetical protein
MQTNGKLYPLPPPRPKSVEKYKEQRKGHRSFHDIVEEIHLMVYECEEYGVLFDAVWDQHAVNGSLTADMYAAAFMLKAKANKICPAVFEGKSVENIKKSMNVIRRRYGDSLKERRNEALRLTKKDGE